MEENINLNRRHLGLLPEMCEWFDRLYLLKVNSKYSHDQKADICKVEVNADMAKS